MKGIGTSLPVAPYLYILNLDALRSASFVIWTWQGLIWSPFPYSYSPVYLIWSKSCISYYEYALSNLKELNANIIQMFSSEWQWLYEWQYTANISTRKNVRLNFKIFQEKPMRFVDPTTKRSPGVKAPTLYEAVGSKDSNRRWTCKSQ